MADQFTARKLWRVDQVLRDKRATHFDFRLAYYIASITDRDTIEARFKQSTAADALDVTRRAIQISSERLKALGHIDISFTPGRTHLNGYRLCLEKTNEGSPLDVEKANVDTPIEDGKANLSSPIQDIKGERLFAKRRTAVREKANRHSHQSSLVSIPCLIPESCRVAKATPIKKEYSEDFEANFWKPYPKSPNMSKKEAWREWLKLSPAKRLAACQAIPGYERHLKQKPNLETVHACRFLSQERAETILELAAERPKFDIRGSIV
jgi:hypothetical protein